MSYYRKVLDVGEETGETKDYAKQNRSKMCLITGHKSVTELHKMLGIAHQPHHIGEKNQTVEYVH